jgi:hypothetical protein
MGLSAGAGGEDFSPVEGKDGIDREKIEYEIHVKLRLP